MKAFVYLPEDQATIEDFKQKLQDLHTDEFIRKLKELPCSDREKIKFIESLQEKQVS